MNLDEAISGLGKSEAKLGAVHERQAVVAFLRDEADAACHAQANAPIDSPDKLYRMGQKDGLLLAAEAISRKHHLASVDTHPKDGDVEQAEVGDAEKR